MEKYRDIRDIGITSHKIGCPECGSSDANQVYKYASKPDDSYCFACETYFPNNDGLDKVVPIKQNINTTYEAKVMKGLDEIKKLPILPIPDRGITKEVAEKYRVRAGLSEQDGKTITHLYCPDTLDGKLIGFECKETKNKKFQSIGSRKGSFDLWGSWTCNGGNKLFITEGRLDAMALHQTIEKLTPEKYQQYKPSVVSLTRGVSNANKDLLSTSNQELLAKYKEVILVFDNDEAGKQAVKECLKVMPLCKVAKLPLKDANEMVMKGRDKELYEACLFNATSIRRGEIIEVNDDLIAKALARPEKGLSTCWGTLDKITHNGILRPNSIVVLASYAKAGKSEFKNQLVKHIIIEHNRPVGVYDLEVAPIKSLKQIASKLAGTNFLLPDNNYDDRLLASTLDRFKGKLFLYDRTGSRDWQDIKTCMIEQHYQLGICEFFLDPLTALISRFNSSEANDKLNEIMTDIADLVSTYPITIICFSHVNPPNKGSKSHEEGGKVLSGQMTGSRAIEKWSHIGLGLERNRSAECPPEEVNHSQVKILYDREHGTSGTVDMFYNQDTTEYLETIKRKW